MWKFAIVVVISLLVDFVCVMGPMMFIYRFQDKDYVPNLQRLYVIHGQIMGHMKSIWKTMDCSFSTHDIAHHMPFKFGLLVVIGCGDKMICLNLHVCSFRTSGTLKWWN
jgi:hypothetical protein